MSVIPGKYIDKNGNEAVVIGVAADGDSGEKTVIYRMGGGGMLTLTQEAWERDGRFIPAQEADFENYMEDKSETELARRMFELFSSKNGIYSLHWRNSLGVEGYNYACENYRLVSGCYRGSDSCKNCRSGRLSVFSEGAVEEHLRGESTVGVYPVDSDGGCRLLVMEAGSKAQLDALRSVCVENDIPCSCEAFGKGFRLWIFFAEKIHIRHIRRLGNAVITKAMERCEEISFDLYDKFIPCRDETAPGSPGFQTVLPFGKSGKKEKSRFIDENGNPLPGAEAEIFRIRTLTKAYLADRLNTLQDVNFGGLWDNFRRTGEALEFSESMQIILDSAIAIPRSALTPKTAAVLKRMACIKNREKPFCEFEAADKCIFANFTQDQKYLRLPRGLWDEVENILKISGAKYSVVRKTNGGDKAHFTLSKPLSEEQSRALEQMSSRSGGIFLAPLGWGKTGMVAGLIAKLKVSTLILTADEKTRQRWVENILALLGTDTERSASKIHVRLVTDKKIKDKYALVILADCSRLPMDEEIFGRISSLTPERIYGITSADRRSDGKWGFIHMLCGGVVSIGE